MSAKTSAILLLAAVCCVETGILDAGQVRVRGSEGPVEMEADTITVDREKQTVEAEGSVRVRSGETVLTADRLRYRQDTDEAFADGDVVLIDPQGELKADSMRLGLGDETATLVNGNLYVETNRFRIMGRKFEKFPGQRYQISDGEFTTCSCASGTVPWKFTARELELTPEGTGIASGVTFHLFDIPILYIPKALYPVRRERQSGFLFPKVGSSSKDGFKAEVPFYWAISPSSDATAALATQTKTRTGFLGEWRQLFSRESRSQVDIAFYNESQRNGKDRKEARQSFRIADPSIPINRGSFSSRSDIVLGRGWKASNDVFLVSDDLFLREVQGFSFDDDVDRQRKTRRFRESRLGVWKGWESYALHGEASYVQDYIQDDDFTIQRLPSVLFFGRQSIGESPVEFRLQSEAVRFSADRFIGLKSGSGVRGDFYPQVVLPVGFGDYFHGSVSGALRETVYQLDHDSGKTRQLAEIRGRLGTQLEKIFQIDEGHAVKHTLEPEIGYHYIPFVNQNDLPLFDEVDRINQRNQFTFALTSRILLRPDKGKRSEQEAGGERPTSPVEGEPVEVLFLRLAENYDLNGDQELERERLSDIQFEGKLLPYDFFSLGWNTVLDPQPGGTTPDSQGRTLKSARVTFSLWDPRPDPPGLYLAQARQRSRLDFGYRYIAKNVVTEEDLLPRPMRIDKRTTDIRELDANIRLKISDYLGLAAQSIYDAEDNRFLRNRGGVRIISRCDCWILDLAFGRTTKPEKTEFLAQVTLGGLGTAGKDPFR